MFFLVYFPAVFGSALTIWAISEDMSGPAGLGILFVILAIVGLCFIRWDERMQQSIKIKDHEKFKASGEYNDYL